MRNNDIDPYINDVTCIQRLINEWVKHKSLIIAYDYDNTVFDYHGVGFKFTNIISVLQECKEYGCKFIVFSCSPPERHPEMISYLTENNIPFDTINKNIIELHGGHGKVFYNILLDDRAGLKSSFSILNVALTVIKENPKDENEACQILKNIYGKRIQC
jgi:hypothetical protein